MYWLLVATDHQDMEKKRAEIREAHRDYIWRSDLPAKLILGAPLLKTVDGAMGGSWLLLEANSLDDVRVFSQNDPYQLAGIFSDVTITALHDSFDPHAQINRSLGLNLRGTHG